MGRENKTHRRKFHGESDVQVQNRKFQRAEVNIQENRNQIVRNALFDIGHIFFGGAPGTDVLAESLPLMIHRRFPKACSDILHNLDWPLEGNRALFLKFTWKIPYINLDLKGGLQGERPLPGPCTPL